MLNVYLTIQRLKHGIPQESQVKIIKYRKLGTPAEAFADVLNQLGDFVAANPTTPYRNYLTDFGSLIGQVSAKNVSAASGVVNDHVLIVSTLVGEQCELVAARGY